MGLLATEPKTDEEREKKWRAESDMRTLREAVVIANDPGRLDAAKDMMQEEIAALNAAKGKIKDEA